MSNPDEPFDAWWEKPAAPRIGAIAPPAPHPPLEDQAPGLVASLEYLIGEYGVISVQQALTDIVRRDLKERAKWMGRGVD